MASIANDNVISEHFILEKGTKQGCPASGFLFNLTTEPLAKKIRSEKNIKGIKIGSQIHQTSPLPNRCGLLTLYISWIIIEYGSLPGYKVNYK